MSQKLYEREPKVDYDIFYYSTPQKTYIKNYNVHITNIYLNYFVI